MTYNSFYTSVSAHTTLKMSINLTINIKKKKNGSRSMYRKEMFVVTLIAMLMAMTWAMIAEKCYFMKNCTCILMKYFFSLQNNNFCFTKIVFRRLNFFLYMSKLLLKHYSLFWLQFQVFQVSFWYILWNWYGLSGDKPFMKMPFVYILSTASPKYTSKL